MEPRDMDLTKVTQAAIRLGMTTHKNLPHIFFHPDIPNQMFDLSATDPSKIMLTIWKRGIEHGKNEKVKAICRELKENKEFFITGD
jgi:hypothetical protein